MARPRFLWDLILKLGLGVFGIAATSLFWLLVPIFLILNLLVSWHRLWRYFGVWNLATFRFIMRRRNLFDTASLPTKPQPPDSRRIRWNPLWRTARTADGSFNDLQDPLMGSAHTRFARNFSLARLASLFKTAQDEDMLVSPNPRQISKTLLTRDRFKPASSLNVLAAAWIQFQVHDWFAHSRRPPAPPFKEKTDKEYLPSILLDDEDKKAEWPGGEQDQKNPAAYVMRIRRTEIDESVDRNSKDFPVQLNALPIYRNTETHWWDGSQLYGSSSDKQTILRAHDGSGKLKLDRGRLPADPHRPGMDLTGFNDNYWAGLSLLHTLFVLEHNAICDRLKESYPGWKDERLFQTARLIIAALLAKIHTVEWTPAILGHPTLYLGMRANWWGIVGQRLNKFLGRLPFLRDIQEEITGIPGSDQDHHAAAFAMTEEFVSVYRMHPLIPDDYRIYSLEEDELKIACPLNDLQGDHTRDFLKRAGIENLFYSFGVAHPGAITLKNFPRALQNFERTQDGDHVFQKPETLDLASVDIMRDRERAIPRYNNFRRMLMLLPCFSYKRLVGVPLLPWFSGLTKREIKERKNWARELQKQYPNKEDLDLMVGLFAETRPKGFGFSDTAFRIFVLMAPRRLKSDRFITTDFNPDVYTQLGMDWIENNTFKSVLLRHFPVLAPALDEVNNAFTPWQRTERPSPDPVEHNPATEDPRPAMRRITAFQMPFFGGAFIGWIVGAVVKTWKTGHGFGFFDSLVTDTAVYGAAIGAIIGGFCLASIYAFTWFSTGQLTLRERVQSGAGWGATVGWFIGALVNLWITERVLAPLTQILLTMAGALFKSEAAIGALLGAGIGIIRERSSSQIIRGIVIGWLIGAAWYLWQTDMASLGELTDNFLQAGHALATREALIGAFVGATIGVACGRRKIVREISMRAAIWRAIYGVVFGGVIGAGIGILWSVVWGFTENFAVIVGMAVIAPFLIIAGIAIGAICEVKDSLIRRDRLRFSSFLTIAFVGGALVALVWMMEWLAGGENSIFRVAWNALDALTFHAAKFGIFGAILGLALWVGGWVSVAAGIGGVLGAVIYCIKQYQGAFFDAVFSSEAGTGAVTGTFLLAALMTFFVREFGWIIVGGVRGALLGAVAGILYHLGKVVTVEDAGKLAHAAFTSQDAIWGTMIVALIVGAIWLVRGPEITWILRRLFWSLWGWFKFVGNRHLNVTPPRQRCLWKFVTWLRFFADRRAQAAKVRATKILAPKDDASPLENFWCCVKYRLDCQLRRSKHAPRLDKLPVIPFAEKYGIPIYNIRVSGTIPPDERSRMKSLVYRIQVHLYSVFSPMQPEELPPISADPYKALKQAYGFLQRRAFDAPELPPEFEGNPDLGSLAVRGPYSAYLQKVKSSSNSQPHFEWDLRDLDQFEVHKELYPLGVHALFRAERQAGRNTNLLVPYRIEYPMPDKRRHVADPSTPDWQFAKKLVLCALTTHQSLVRHFNWVHLAGGEPFAIATRTCLPSDHALCRFLWPHIYGTQQSNTVVTKGQMVKEGDFETIFSFTYQGMCDLFTQTYNDFNLIRYDPKMDAERREVRDCLLTLGIETTSQHNLEELFEVMHQHVQRYLLVYYENDGSIELGKHLSNWFQRPEYKVDTTRSRWESDRSLRNWLNQLKDLIPSHQGPLNPRSLAELASLLARFLYLVTVEHEKGGSFLWNYQLWSHRQSCRVYKKGTREPLDVYQRLVNANFNLNVHRLSLMEDFSYLALDDAGAAAFLQFQKDLQALQGRMEKDPWSIWKIYPHMLEANINA